MKTWWRRGVGSPRIPHRDMEIITYVLEGPPRLKIFCYGFPSNSRTAAKFCFDSGAQAAFAIGGEEWRVRAGQHFPTFLSRIELGRLHSTNPKDQGGHSQ